MLKVEKKVFVSIPCSCLSLLLYNCEVLEISARDYLSAIVVNAIQNDYEHILACESIGEHNGNY